MSIFKLVPKENKVLHSEAKIVTDFGSPKLLVVVKGIEKTMLRENGVGLAAPQVGISSQIFTVDIDYIERVEEELRIQKKEFPGMKSIKKLLRKKVPVIYINPKIISKSKETILSDEGCLSVPQTFGTVRRSTKVTVEAYDENGKRFRFTGTGLLAQVYQHETNHLVGQLFTERVLKGTLNTLKENEKKN